MAVLTALAIASTAMSAGNAVLAGRNARRQGRAENALADQNAGFLDAQAADALARGAIDESRLRTDTSRLGGAQRAALAAQGIDLTDGSAADIQDETQLMGELDALTVRNNARREAWGYRVEAWDMRQRGRAADAAGRAGQSSASLQAGATLLGGAANIYGAYKQDAGRRGTRVSKSGGSGAGGVTARRGNVAP